MCKTVFTWIFIILSIGALRLIFYWKPNWFIRCTHRRISLSLATQILLKVGYHVCWRYSLHCLFCLELFTCTWNEKKGTCIYGYPNKIGNQNKSSTYYQCCLFVVLSRQGIEIWIQCFLPNRIAYYSSIYPVIVIWYSNINLKLSDSWDIWIPFKAHSFFFTYNHAFEKLGYRGAFFIICSC